MNKQIKLLLILTLVLQGAGIVAMDRAQQSSHPAARAQAVAQERKADESVERKTTKEQDEAMAAQQAQLRALAFQNYELARAGLSQ